MEIHKKRLKNCHDCNQYSKIMKSYQLISYTVLFKLSQSWKSFDKVKSAILLQQYWKTEKYIVLVCLASFQQIKTSSFLTLLFLSFSPVDVYLSILILIQIIRQPSTTLTIQEKVTVFSICILLYSLVQHYEIQFSWKRTI